MSLFDLAVEILNEAKLSSDAKDKLYKLEQIKEIVFFRDETLLPHILPELQIFMMDRSIPIRKFIFMFTLEAFIKDNSYFDSFISLFRHFVFDAAANQESLLRLIANAITKHYGVLAVYISKLPAVGATAVTELKKIWSSLQETIARLLDSISSPQSDSNRSQYIRLAQEVVLFGVPAPAASIDPRVARVTKRANINDVPLHHAFISPTQIEEDADSFFNKMLLWMGRGGPQGYAFSPNVTSQLVSSVCTICSERRSKIVMGTKALHLFVRDKASTVFAAMDTDAKESVLRAVERVVSAARSVTELSELSAKLQNGVETLSNILSDSQRDAKMLKKRSVSGDLASLSVDAADEDESLPATDLSASVKAAVDAAEAERRTKRANIAATALMHADLNLCPDLLSLPVAVAKTPMITISFQQSGMLAKSEAQIAPAQLPSNLLDDLSLVSLRRSLDAYTSLVAAPEIQRSLCKVVVRTILLFAYADVEGGRQLSAVKVFLTSPSGASSRVHLPSTVNIPRSTWLAIGYCLQQLESILSEKTTKTSKRQQDQVGALLIHLFVELYERWKLGGSDPEALKLYGDLAMALLSRCVEKRSLRALTKQWLLTIPVVPQDCVSLIGMLATRVSESVAGDKRTTKDLMPLLCDVAVGAQSGASREHALKTLLWFCVADEFDIRVKAITFLIKELVGKSDSIMYHVIEFAIHAAVHLVGVDAVLGLANVAENKQEEAEEVASEDVMLLDEEPRQEKLADFARRFDGGKSFGGSFSDVPAEAERFEEHAKNHLHLLSQLALSQTQLLVILVEIFAVNQQSIQLAKVSGDPSITRAEVLKRILRDEVGHVVPVVMQSQAVDEVVDAVMEAPTAASELVIDIFALMFREDRIPPSSSIVSKVQGFASRLEGRLRDKALVTVIGGLPQDEVKALLTVLVKTLGTEGVSGMEELEKVFARVYRARPPPLSKAALLIHLHRMEMEDSKVQKAVLDSIEICLRNKAEFRGDTLKEVIAALLEDEVPALPLMRTAIRAAQGLSDMRNFALTDVIPRLIAKEVFSSAPKVWEGVVLASRLLIEQKDAEIPAKVLEPMMKAVLGLPVKHMEGLLASTPKLVPMITAMLGSMSEDEQRLVMLGQAVLGLSEADISMAVDEKVEALKVKKTS